MSMCHAVKMAGHHFCFQSRMRQESLMVKKEHQTDFLFFLFFSVCRIVSKLPEANGVLLQHLLCLLCRIIQRSEKNKMDPKNLAICIAPTLLQPGSLKLDVSTVEKVRHLSSHSYSHSPERLKSGQSMRDKPHFSSFHLANIFVCRSMSVTLYEPKQFKKQTQREKIVRKKKLYAQSDVYQIYFRIVYKLILINCQFRTAFCNTAVEIFEIIETITSRKMFLNTFHILVELENRWINQLGLQTLQVFPVVIMHSRLDPHCLKIYI